MRKRNIFITVVLITSIALMGLDVYENKKQEAIAKTESERIYTVSDILKDADFNEKPTLNIRAVVSTLLEPHPIINVENEEQQKRIMDAINNLQLKKTNDATPLKDVDYLINIKLNKEYALHVFEKKKQIQLLDLNNDSTEIDDEYLYYYTILNGDEFFDALKDIQ
ncbi:hypothetical protein AMS59_13590 [Lysinibacillus sp. FJAT-14745]|uniref:hypothetical protein n=1 Tax=Lysinibacillus sp. FJAT-14745 TaxID=1704289 RepID=UPI0006AB9E9D|nr:hypothetical protein [Lysinibacillus sp. FJAT-14745]KOP78131.1 hypothetical protein AMS59_13590 [Lysinibacillus sp. FJAT-14745]